MSDQKSLEKDLAAIRALAGVLEDTGLSEIEIERGELRLRVSRGGATTLAYAGPAAAPQSGAPAAAAPVASEAEANLADHPGAIKSPMVGTAYMAPSPGAATFVNVGDTVSAGQTLMIVEAMKTMNDIKAPKAGKLTQILARDAEPVEFGEVLMIIE